MPDTQPATPLANPVIPNDAFATAARAAMASARSPLEAAAQQQVATHNQQVTDRAAADTQRPTVDFNRPAVQPLDQPGIDANALAQARARDNAKAQAAVDSAAPAKKDQQQQQAATTATDDPADPSVSSEPWKQHSKKKVSVRGTANDWDALKAQHAEEVAALRKEYESKAVGDPTKHPDFIKLKAEHAEYLDALKQVAVERDPDFKAKFDTRRDAIMSTIRGLSGNAREDIEAILELRPGPARDKALAKALESFQPTTQATLMGHLTALAQVDAERAGELASRKASFDANQQQLATRQQQAAREREQQLNAALDKQLAKWSDPEEGYEFFQLRDGDDRWNRQVEKRVALARSIFAGETDAATLAQASLKAAAHDAALQLAYEATKEVERLTAQLARFNGITTGDSSLAASIMQSGANDATITANPYDPRYVNHFAASLEEARKADGLSAR